MQGKGCHAEAGHTGYKAYRSLFTWLNEAGAYSKIPLIGFVFIFLTDKATMAPLLLILFDLFPNVTHPGGHCHIVRVVKALSTNTYLESLKYSFARLLLIEGQCSTNLVAQGVVENHVATR